VHVIGSGGLLDPYGEWAAVREVSATGCVLARPDRHIAWRAPRIEPNSADQLATVLAQVLGRNPSTTNKETRPWAYTA
jgi:2,4-dichlorophenol 6-monooxygenase